MMQPAGDRVSLIVISRTFVCHRIVVVSVPLMRGTAPMHAPMEGVPSGDFTVQPVPSTRGRAVHRRMQPVLGSVVGLVYDRADSPPQPEGDAIPLELRRRDTEIDSEMVKQLLLLHVRACTDRQCCTCAKLRSRIVRARRRLALWRFFRRAARIAGVLCLARARAAERLYAPGGAGFVQALDHFEERAAKQRRLS